MKNEILVISPGLLHLSNGSWVGFAKDEKGVGGGGGLIRGGIVSGMKKNISKLTDKNYTRDKH